jgi:hypothetical protein
MALKAPALTHYHIRMGREVPRRWTRTSRGTATKEPKIHSMFKSVRGY